MKPTRQPLDSLPIERQPVPPALAVSWLTWLEINTATVKGRHILPHPVRIKRRPGKLDYRGIANNINKLFGKAVMFIVLVFVMNMPGIMPGATSAFAQIRIKDIVTVEGIRNNQLIGYGLVVGLNGTGDDLNNAAFTRDSLIGMLERLGISADEDALDTNNLAAVIVTATLPPFARQGTTIDITISALGDASSLDGGVLLVTPLQGADGEVYAVAQGSITIGGFNIQGQAQIAVRGVPTRGRIAGGAIVEREIDFELNTQQTVKLSLANPDLVTANRIAQAINQQLSRQAAIMLDPSTIQLTPPAGMSLASTLAAIEPIAVEVDQAARVVVDESTGIIVMGGNVRIGDVAVAQANLSVRVTETPIVSQANPFAPAGETVVVPRTEIVIDENAEQKLVVVPEAATLQELVNGLNALGISPRDLISILHAIKAAGALQAEISTL